MWEAQKVRAPQRYVSHRRGGRADARVLQVWNSGAHSHILTRGAQARAFLADYWPTSQVVTTMPK